MIGLPDLYDIDYGQNYENEATPGAWHVMDGGSYNNDGNTPPNYTIYDKYFLGWKTPTNPGNTKQTLTLAANGQSGYQGYQITTGNSLLAYNSTSTIYYIENRQQSGWDKYVPGHGLVIWKVTYNSTAWNNNGPNNDDGTLRYTIVSASGKTTGLGTAADPFPGTQRKTEWRGVNGKPLLNITEKNSIISLSYIEEVDESICSYEVLYYENATVSSESGEIAKGGTITLTVTPALGYVLTEENIEVEIEGSAKDFTYSGTTLTIPNVTGDVAIYIMPEIDPENAITFTRLTNTAMLQADAQCILVYAETPAVAGQLMNNTYLASVTEGFTVNGTEITTQKTNTDISIFTLGGSPGAWTLTNSEGKKLSGTTDKLGWDGANNTWTITIGTDSKTVMTVGGTQLYYNSSSPRFRTYTSAQKGLYLYISQSGEIVKQDPVITFSKTGDQTIKLNQTLSNPATSTYGTVTYSSSDSETATVNSSGVVTPKKAGTVTITASVAAGTYNNAASKSYKVTIQALTQYTVTWMASGSQHATATYDEGAKLVLPTTNPAACSNTKEFVGWTAIRDYQNPFCPPTDLFHTAEGKTVTANITYYAVYKTN